MQDILLVDKLDQYQLAFIGNQGLDKPLQRNARGRMRAAAIERDAMATVIRCLLIPDRTGAMLSGDSIEPQEIPDILVKGGFLHIVCRRVGHFVKCIQTFFRFPDKSSAFFRRDPVFINQPVLFKVLSMLPRVIRY